MENSPDWTLIRSFLAVAEAGSLSAAARALGQSQPTLGRHIAALEAALGAALVTRVPRGLALTSAGQALLPEARAMAEAAARLALAAAGREERLAGSVRLTASRVVAHYILPPMLADLRLRFPDIQIDLSASDQPESLFWREADLALRMFRPEEEGLVIRHLADLPIGLYAARSYLDRAGRPATLDELFAHQIVGFDRSDLMLRMMRRLGVERRREDFGLRCDDQLVYWALVRAGAGIGGMQRLVGDADPGMERVAPDLNLPALPVWLTLPEALRQTPRVRAVADHLAAGFAALGQPRA